MKSLTDTQSETETPATETPATETPATETPVALTPQEECDKAFMRLQLAFNDISSLRPLAAQHLAKRLTASCSKPTGKAQLGRPHYVHFLATVAYLTGRDKKAADAFIKEANQHANEGHGAPFVVRQRSNGEQGASSWRLQAPASASVLD